MSVPLTYHRICARTEFAYWLSHDPSEALAFTCGQNCEGLAALSGSYFPVAELYTCMAEDAGVRHSTDTATFKGA